MIASLIQDVVMKVLGRYVEALKPEDMEIDVLLSCERSSRRETC